MCPDVHLSSITFFPRYLPYRSHPRRLGGSLPTYCQTAEEDSQYMAERLRVGRITTRLDSRQIAASSCLDSLGQTERLRDNQR